MVAVAAGEVDPLFTGIAYCQLIEMCQSILDLRRAREWTDSLTRWCEAQPDLVPHQGECLVYRSEIQLLLGAWADAEETARRASSKLAAQRAWITAGSAHYQLAEIHRLRGDYSRAEEEYGRASEYGRDPEPGMSLLRLAQGRLDAARAGVERTLNEAGRAPSRARILPPYVEIMLAAGDVDAAEDAAAALGALAGQLDTPFLQAMAGLARGSVLLARSDAAGALEALREACHGFQEVEAPYPAARARMLIAAARRELGDEDAAMRDLESARTAFERLGATADVARVDALGGPPAPVPRGLSQRELEVLLLLARGMTNRQISAELVVSENTVARHVQNIFAKLGVSSRAAATAFAFEHKLV
jgi:ATP/maltotriose-dependent transcriptional regulator MalT